jgi:protoporphyrinogen oxidase
MKDLDATGKGMSVPREGMRGVATARRRVRMDGRPTMSVVIAARGAEPDLEALVGALLPECEELGAEVVVARACSQDELQRLAERVPYVRWVQCDASSTRFDLRSAGMADAEGDIVAFVDDDRPVTAERLAHLRTLVQPVNGSAATAAELAADAWADEYAPAFTNPAPILPPVRAVDRLAPDDHVVIIGAGPGGLTPAYLLAKRGVQVTVLEADDVVGGISRTAQYNGYRFDIGGHRFFTKIKPVEDFWKEILADEFISVPRLSRIHYDGKFFDYPLKAGNALSGLGVWRAVQMVVSYLYAHVRPSPVEENLEQWVTNRFGRRLYEVFFKTYTEKVWGIPCTEIRAEWAAQRIQNLSLAKAILSAAAVNRRSTSIKTLIHEFQYPRLGPGQMWEVCRDKVEALGGRVLMRHQVSGIEVRDGRVVALRCDTPDGPVRIEGDHFISTMPVRNLVRALDCPIPTDIVTAGDGLKYRDFLTVALILDKEDLFPDNWIYIHTPGVKVGRIQNFNNWSKAMVPDAGRTCLGMEYFCFEGDGLWTSRDEDLIALAAVELEALGLGKGAKVLDGTVVRMPKAYPVYDSTYREHLDVVRSFIDPIPNLHLVGRNGMHKYNNQDHSMYTAMLTLENLDGADHDVWSVNTDFDYHEEQKVDKPAAARPAPAGVAG